MLLIRFLELSEGMFAKVCDCVGKPWRDMMIFTQLNPKINSSFILGIYIPELHCSISISRIAYHYPNLHNLFSRIVIRSFNLHISLFYIAMEKIDGTRFKPIEKVVSNKIRIAIWENELFKSKERITNLWKRIFNPW